MKQTRIGVAVTSRDVTSVAHSAVETLAYIEDLEKMGINAAWLTSGSPSDPMTSFAAAAVRTKRILLGTSIVPILPRHPVIAAQQAHAIASLAPGRFRLGVGPSHKATMENTFGFEFNAPLTHLEEYVRIAKTLLSKGSVDFDGRFYKAHARIPAPIDVPVMASALRQKSFELCGEITDGAISWVCPGVYLRDVAFPAMQAGAKKAGRPVPPLIAHAPVCVHDNVAEVYAAARQQIGHYPKVPFYAAMFTDAGFPEVKNGEWSERMLDAVVLHGNEERVKEKLLELFSFGASEVLVTPITAGPDRAASLDRTLRLLAEASGGKRRR